MNNTVVLHGNLNFLTLADLLQLLGSNGSSGTLQLTTQYSPEPGFIYIEKGNPIHAVASNLTGIDAIYSLFGWVDGEFNLVLEIFVVIRISLKIVWKLYSTD